MHTKNSLILFHLDGNHIQRQFDSRNHISHRERSKTQAMQHHLHKELITPYLQKEKLLIELNNQINYYITHPDDIQTCSNIETADTYCNSNTKRNVNSKRKKMLMMSNNNVHRRNTLLSRRGKDEPYKVYLNHMRKERAIVEREEMFNLRKGKEDYIKNDFRLNAYDFAKQLKRKPFCKGEKIKYKKFVMTIPGFNLQNEISERIKMKEMLIDNKNEEKVNTYYTHKEKDKLEDEMLIQGKNHVCSGIVTEYPLRYYKLLDKTNALKKEVRTHFKFL